MTTPNWKVYRDGEYVASTKYPEDAAMLIAGHGAGVVKWRHQVLVWEEGAEEFQAGESYDRAGDVMRARLRKYAEERSPK